MSNYNWCHNPDCHTIHTQSRIRGTGDNKVLRTMRIKVGRFNYMKDNSPNIWDYFCNQNCLMRFLGRFCTEIANTYSVKKPSETPIKVRTEKYENYRYRWTDNGSERIPYTSTRKIIENSS